MHDFVVWLQHVLVSHLGTAGMVMAAFVIAVLDSSFLSVPEVNDFLVVTQSAALPARAWMFVVATTLGSIAGCSILWLIGKRGGEPLLVRRFGAARVEQARTAFHRWDILALAVPAVLPPPAPFKVFVFSAGVFGIPFRRFVLTIAIARGVRYCAWGLMGARYGRHALSYLKRLDHWFAHYDIVILPVVIALLLVAVLLVLRRRPGNPASA
jgi:membrane protein YqaA with SNARE-associated domain